MSQQGIFSWSLYRKTLPIWLSGREIGTADNLMAQLRFTYPEAAGGVPVGGGWFGQVTTASPRASSAATARPTLTLEYNPSLDEDTNRHGEDVYAAAIFSTAKLWLPVPIFDSWRIEAARTNYTVAHTISGSSGARGQYVEPIVEVRDLDGTLDSALSYVASSPSSTEFTLVSATTADQDVIVTGDLTAKDGKRLTAWSWCILDVRVVGGLDQGFDGPNNWTQIIELELAPQVKDYEADV